MRSNDEMWRSFWAFVIVVGLAVALLGGVEGVATLAGVR